jgi:hypothetical protein
VEGSSYILMFKDVVWAEVAREVVFGDRSVEKQTEFYGRWIADCVITDRLPIADLRACVQFANELDHEAVISVNSEEARSDDPLGEALPEFTARRIFHASTKTALDMVKSRRRRIDHAVDYGKRRRSRVDSGMPGMGRLEGKDLCPEGFVVQQGQGTLNERNS